ncbi:MULTISPECIES: ABC transporter ATP-binding protein [Halolamina]|uniref:Nickel import system ATP-binding protein NikD n=1 Tax=Halolamina pelagica TaxID=699431 RepID=A0A1I5MLP3_9EURY|nr:MULTISPECIES: ABC transporter ATP-binding protein [Halolamina]NHX36080.1 ABC transporter ATP-binding protein [Halolamina sp. R1-12]SFP10525.1 peptide/nickel transport system ATP-binding protein [Halolamina pelagica]
MVADSSRSDAGTAAEPADDRLLEVENLQTVFHTERETIRAVDGISFGIAEGETLGLVGESGSGKSVTARSIMGLVDSPGELLPDSSIRFDGRELTGLSETQYESVRGGGVAMVFQDPLSTLNPVYTVGNQIEEALSLHRGLSGLEATEKAIELLEDVGIPDAARRVSEYPHEFSGGMRQRAVIAMALACDPDLLICDEPTTALDVTIQAQILELLADLQEEHGLSILFITHDMGVIAEVCDRVAVMYAGEVVEQAPVVELFENPRHPYTRGLLRSIPSTQRGADRLETIEGEVPTPNAPATDCRFAPRCPEAFDACREVHPEPVPVATETADADADHTAACLLYPEDETREQAVDRHAIEDAPPGAGAVDSGGESR